MRIEEDKHLAHYGILRKSGRYPWGSGGTELSRSRTFLQTIDELKASGEFANDTEIARGLGMTTTELRTAKSLAKNIKKQADIAMVQRLSDKGMSNVAIERRTGIPESTVRSLLAPGQKDKLDVLHTTANFLKDQVDEKGFIDVGTGTEHHVLGGVSANTMKNAIAVLKEQGYAEHKVQVDQGSSGNKTTIRVLAPPGTTYRDIVSNKEKISLVTGYSENGGRSFLGLLPPLSVKSSRIGIRYAEEGGKDADGVIFVRPGVPDLSMGRARYAQVRIAVDGTHYLKGMAMYKDDLPKGVDLVFNTNKSNTGNKLDAMKAMKDDPDNPFGSVVRQLGEHDQHGQLKKVTSAMNIVYEEGNWDTWSRSLSSQFLSKQSPKLAKNQLDMAFERKKNELDQIMSLTNPAVRRKLLTTFADEADKASVTLKAAQLPRQSSHVILPINSLKENEIYAPNYKNGERVVLVRHPHGGPFEIPELIVNNRHPEAKKLLGSTPDAVGIHHKVAERLSGADFDGDTVIVIPNGQGRVKTAPALEKLKDFDPQREFPAYEGMPKMKPSTKQTEMGKISNLITDMSIRGANATELAAAVRHSMVVIDAEKHNLDYRRSRIDNGIPNLEKKYQSPYNETGRPGASTLISRAKSRLDIPERKPRPAAEGGPINRTTGRKEFVPTGRTKVNAKGVEELRTQRTTKLGEATDAHKLSSGTVIEKVYAEHSNRLKSLADSARLETVHTPSTPYSPSARKAYATEVASLNAKLTIALRNRPLERQARILADKVIRDKKAANPDMDKTEIKRLEAQALNEARTRTGAKKEQIHITDSEWHAIQAGAITNHKLTDILNNADLNRVKELATPRAKILMTSTKVTRARDMINLGYTQAEIANALGVSLTTLKNSLGGEG